MSRICYIFFVIVLAVNCKSPEEEKSTPNIVDGTQKYEVYQGSEMSTLMQGMYAYNLQIKNEIKAGVQPTEFPDVFLNIHTAQLSDTKTRNDTFQFYSTEFIKAERLVFVEDATKAVSQRYNDAIMMCVACHKSECTGPIPKIKKLLIQ
ncbi:hypothetical protein ACU8DI_08735 [Psychroserpens sp. BH13MA-6]